MARTFNMYGSNSLHSLIVNWRCWIMSAKSGNVDDEDDPIHTVGDCQDQMCLGLKYISGTEQFLRCISKVNFE